MEKTRAIERGNVRSGRHNKHDPLIKLDMISDKQTKSDLLLSDHLLLWQLNYTSYRVMAILMRLLIAELPK